jgi:hypothetical protein
MEQKKSNQERTRKHGGSSSFVDTREPGKAPRQDENGRELIGPNPEPDHKYNSIGEQGISNRLAEEEHAFPESNVTAPRAWYRDCTLTNMSQTTTRNKNRKRQTKRRRPIREREVSGSMSAKRNRNATSDQRNAERSRVPEMPEELSKSRTGAPVGESLAIAVSPTGTKHFPLDRKVPRIVRSRAKSPSIGRQKQGRTAKARRTA